MSQHESDISWQTLRRILQEWAGNSAELAEVKPLEGGCINTTLMLASTAGDRAVLKISPHRVNRDYSREAHQLNLLRELGLPTPRVYLCNVASLDNPDSYLLMEFVEGSDLGAAKNSVDEAQFNRLQENLAELVLTMHSRTRETYGRVMDVDAPTYSSWAQFYREVFTPIWQELEKSPLLNVRQKKTITRVHEKLDRLLSHADVPRLVHFDLWSTNVLCRENGDGKWHIAAILDPNCKYAHFEAEIAYLDLFHTINPAFKGAYQQVHKLSDDYHRIRKPIYQLYPLIDHVNLFGPKYMHHLSTAIERVTPLV